MSGPFLRSTHRPAPACLSFSRLVLPSLTSQSVARGSLIAKLGGLGQCRPQPTRNAAKCGVTLREPCDGPGVYGEIVVHIRCVHAPAQASWTDKSGNHSVGQLANHLVFWDRASLAKFKGEKPVNFDGNNDETFNNFDAKSWDVTVKQLDEVMTDWEQAVEAADDAKVSLWASRIAHIGTHNAYHIGQMVYVRKLQGVWDPDKGVK